MHPSTHAASTPDKPAIIMAETGEQMSYRALDEASNRAAQLYRAMGLGRGDTVALFLDNQPLYLALCWGAQRAGLYFTCISTRLSPAEADYIVRDCGARLFIASASLGEAPGRIAALLPADVRRLSVRGALPGFEAYEPLAAAQPASRIADESQGRDMLYSSGTTGRPKGIRGELSDAPIDAPDTLVMLIGHLYGFGNDTVYLSPAPLYHAAPLRYCMSAQKLGGTIVIMEHFEPQAALAAIERYRITHSQWVPTMFVRMLKLPDAVRAAHDLSSHKVAIHAAAPCPVEVKQRMLAWWGPLIHEYYSATEGAGFTAISPQDWLQRPGSVGKALLGTIRIVDDEGVLLPPGREGRVFFEGGPAFSYHGDPGKTQESYNQAGWATFGDVGYVDADGYLFLTDRKAFMIISGGVNVYPQETENVLVMHPKVADAAVIGVPHEELGEQVKAVIQPMDWADAGPELEAELIAFCRQQLSPIKCPKSVDFEPALPRHPTGKLYKRLLRDRYWTKP